VDWSGARDECATQRAHLVSIGTPEEQIFVASWLAGVNLGAQDVWIGLKQTGNNPYQWITGEPMTFSQWARGEPNATTDGCVRIRVTGDWADWNSPCRGPLAAACELEP
jgi:hypothetical protein